MYGIQTRIMGIPIIYSLQPDDFTPKKKISRTSKLMIFSRGWYPIISRWFLLGKKSHRSKWMMTGGTPYVTWETPVFDFCCSSPVMF